jgi:hypothetical protein
MGPRVGLDDAKILDPTGKLRPLGRPALSQSLYWLLNSVPTWRLSHPLFLYQQHPSVPCDEAIVHHIMINISEEQILSFFSYHGS